MTIPTPLLTRRAVVLAAIETEYGTDAGPSPATDALLVEAPDFMPDMNVLERDFVRPSLSTLPHQIGRKLAKISFTTEMRGNGSQNAGTLAAQPRIARLFEMCGYSLTAMAASYPTGVFTTGTEQTVVTWATGGALTNTDVIQYIVECTTPGASGTAEVTVTSDTVGEGSAPAVITSGTAIDLGTKGLTITPTWAGDLYAGQSWVVWALPPGLILTPVSLNQQSGTLYSYMDGVLHVLTGCYGTFSITADAGNYAKIKWEFTGIYNAPTDVALPVPSLETALPPQIQLGRLNINQYPAIVNSFTFTQANDIQPRPDINSTDGYIGLRIVARKPTGGIDPEATLVGTFDWWGQMSNAGCMPFQMRAGLVPGNTIWVIAPNTQFNKMTYKDRSGLRVYDAGMSFPQSLGDDEIFFVMT